jgi:hypothetical protein
MLPTSPQVEPLSRLNAMYTGWATPKVCAKVMLLETPARQLTAVFGDETVIVGLTIVKSTSLMSAKFGLAIDEARIRPLVVAGPVTVHE